MTIMADAAESGRSPQQIVLALVGITPKMSQKRIQQLTELLGAEFTKQGGPSTNENVVFFSASAILIFNQNTVSYVSTIPSEFDLKQSSL